MMCIALVADGRRSGEGQQAMRPGWGKVLEHLAEDSGFLECDAVSLGEQLPTFRSIVMFSFSWSSRPRRTAAQESRVYFISGNTNMILPKDEGIAIFRNVEKYNPNNTVSHPRILASFLTNRIFSKCWWNHPPNCTSTLFLCPENGGSRCVRKVVAFLSN